MKHTNLSTRPFYNERLVHAVLAAVALIVIAVSIANVFAVSSLSRKDAALGADTTRAEKQAADARASAARVRQGIDADRLREVSNAAAEANRLIDRRTFSWTHLLTEFERTLPSDARISSVVPRAGKEGQTHVEINVVARTADDVNSFVEKLEARGSFAGLLPVQQSIGDDGLLQAKLVGRYVGAQSGAGGER